ncbi:hypothetical protein [Lacimicrobium alkaliphilum]|uniref:Uncharacterized protein n=1 Tax=Lacimicrobium alkaliphilum TaxID=1526571 RepID=A0ABQ1RCZ6_9ALTE|nr:hypothetical protein [Lacimicrobium alkaliphilum]GGD63034.1 hypothetical protein GCM10011357_17910 [Lacimicrobium alkaliphilum]
MVRCNSAGFRANQHRQVDKIEQLKQLPDHLRFQMKVVTSVFPYRVNNIVIDELINWGNVPNDALFQLNFPQRNISGV